MRLGRWIPGVWRYWGHGIIFVSCSVLGLKGKEKKKVLSLFRNQTMGSPFGDF